MSGDQLRWELGEALGTGLDGVRGAYRQLSRASQGEGQRMADLLTGLDERRLHREAQETLHDERRGQSWVDGRGRLRCGHLPLRGARQDKGRCMEEGDRSDLGAGCATVSVEGSGEREVMGPAVGLARR